MQAVADKPGTGRVHIRKIIKPLPSQKLLLDAMREKEHILFGGAAGPGKSYILRWAAVELLIAWASAGHRDVRVGLFCESYTVLKDRQIGRIRREFPPWLGYLKETKEEGFGFYLYPEFGSGVISLRNLDDPAKYASAEFAAILVDELTKNTRQTFDDLRFRKRWPGIEHSPFLAGSNPGSIGHAWVKKLWVDRDFSGDDERLNPDSFLFIPAKAGENPYLPKSYWDTLNSLPEAMRRAMLEGDWNVFEGQVFSEWRRDLHVCEPFEIPPEWTRWVAVDYGFAAPFCALWYARPPDKNRLYVYRELYHAEWRATEQAKRILSLSKGETIWRYAADPSMWQKRRETTGDSLADEYKGAGLTLTQANNNRMAGLNAIREALNWKRLPGEGEEGRLIKPPRLQVFSTCPNLIRTLPALPYDPIRIEDVDTDAEDHCLVAETRVLTTNGWQEIADVRAGQRVQTRAGWRLVKASWQTQRDASLLRVRLSNGRSLIGTPKHRIWSNGDWRRLDALRYGDILEPCRTSPLLRPQSRNLRASASTSPGATSAGMAHSSIARFGRRITARFRRAVTFITGMVIGPTTASKTLGFSWVASISAGIVANRVSASVRPALQTSATRRTGTPAQRALSGIASMGGSSLRIGHVYSERASNAGSHIPVETLTRDAAASVVTLARRSTAGQARGTTFSAYVRAAIVALRRIATGALSPVPVRVLGVSDAGRAPVYNLHVEGPHEYYAEGVLVSNCYDTLRYGVMIDDVRPWKRPEPVSLYGELPGGDL